MAPILARLGDGDLAGGPDEKLRAQDAEGQAYVGAMARGRIVEEGAVSCRRHKERALAAVAGAEAHSIGIGGPEAASYSVVSQLAGYIWAVQACKRHQDVKDGEDRGEEPCRVAGVGCHYANPVAGPSGAAACGRAGVGELDVPGRERHWEQEEKPTGYGVAVGRMAEAAAGRGIGAASCARPGLRGLGAV